MKRIGLDPTGAEVDIDRDLVRAEIASALFGRAKVRLCDGRFELIRRRGRGLLGVVYEALDTQRGDRVAIKLLTRHGSGASGQLKDEFQSLSALRHPNLARLDALFAEQGAWFLSMELVNGEPFDAYVRGGASEREARLRSALGQLAAAVTAIHAAGKLHRDLKRSNALVTPERRVVVLDFGLLFDPQQGVPTDEGRSRRKIVGSPAYLAPELLQGRPRSPASDWYAVGVMLYEALTGRRPFAGNLYEALFAKLERAAPDPRALAPDAPLALCALCSRLLERDPQQRAGAEQVEHALAAL